MIGRPYKIVYRAKGSEGVWFHWSGFERRPIRDRAVARLVELHPELCWATQDHDEPVSEEVN